MSKIGFFFNCKIMWVYAYCYVSPLKKDLYRIKATGRVVGITFHIWGYINWEINK